MLLAEDMIGCQAAGYVGLCMLGCPRTWVGVYQWPATNMLISVFKYMIAIGGE